MAIKDVVIIGSGNVAWHLAKELHGKGYRIQQIYGRNENTVSTIAKELSVQYTTNVNEIYKLADIYIISITDKSINNLLPLLNLSGRLVVHTSGSTPMSVFSKSFKSFGVIYPVQSFTKNRPVTFNEIPLLIEGNNSKTEKILLDFARTISGKVVVMNSTKRLYVHLSAIIVNNFSNHLLTMAETFFNIHNLPFELINPLIKETYSKAMDIGPTNAQTGPAKRNDLNIIEKHLDILENFGDLQQIYRLISQHISKTYNK